MPDFVREALIASGLMEAYRERPPYQQNDYVGWINRAKRLATKQTFAYSRLWPGPPVRRSRREQPLAITAVNTKVPCRGCRRELPAERHLPACFAARA